MAHANRGKWAEGQVKEGLALLAKSSTFCYEKLADAYAGFMRAAITDFLVLDTGKIIILEVKEVDHEYRLPKGNFEVEQRNRQKMWALAGASPWILVAFKKLRGTGRLDNKKMWVAAKVTDLPDLGPGQGSWDFRELGTYMTRDEALAYIRANA